MHEPEMAQQLLQRIHEAVPAGLVKEANSNPGAGNPHPLMGAPVAASASGFVRADGKVKAAFADFKVVARCVQS